MALYTRNILSICTGVGQLDIGFRLAVPNAKSVCYVEHEAFPASVLVARIQDKTLDAAPLWSDLRTFDGKPWRGVVDTIIGGFPCQPFSDAGRKRGIDDPRHLWPDIQRIARDANPEECFFENVPGLLTTRTPDNRYAYQVVSDGLQELGYAVEAGLFSAREVGAPQRRMRLFILAHSNSERVGRIVHGQPEERNSRTEPERPDSSFFGNSKSIKCKRGKPARDKQQQSKETIGNPSGVVEYTNITGLEGYGANGQRTDQLSTWPPSPTDTSGWREILENNPSVEPAICRMVDGMDTRMDSSLFEYRQDRLRAVGNGVIPLTVALAYLVLEARLTARLKSSPE